METFLWLQVVFKFHERLKDPINNKTFECGLAKSTKIQLNMRLSKSHQANALEKYKISIMLIHQNSRWENLLSKRRNFLSKSKSKWILLISLGYTNQFQSRLIISSSVLFLFYALWDFFSYHSNIYISVVQLWVLTNNEVKNVSEKYFYESFFWFAFFFHLCFVVLSDWKIFEKFLNFLLKVRLIRQCKLTMNEQAAGKLSIKFRFPNRLLFSDKTIKIINFACAKSNSMRVTFKDSKMNY